MNIIKVESRINGKSSKIDGVIGLAVTCDLIGIEFGNIDALINAIMKFSTFGKLKIEVITGDTYFIEASTSVINVGMVTLTDKMSSFREPLEDNLNPITGEVFDPKDTQANKDFNKNYKGDIAHEVMFDTGRKLLVDDVETSIPMSVHQVADHQAKLVFETLVVPALSQILTHCRLSKGHTKDFIKRYYNTVGNLSFGAIGDALKGTKEEI